jgi:hypothetical protein
MKKKIADASTDPSKITDKFSDNAGDGAVTRYEIDQSIVSPEFANEQTYVEALKKGLPKGTTR